MVKYILFIGLLLCSFGKGYCQKDIELDIETLLNIRLFAASEGFTPGGNGAGLAIGMQIPLMTDFQSRISMEAGSAAIANYVGTNFGTGLEMEIESIKVLFTPWLNVLQGIVLFRPDPFYLWGIEQVNTFSLARHRFNGLGIVIGFRYYRIPEYSSISTINSFLDLRTGIRISF